MALRFNIVREDVSLGIQLDSRDFFGSAFPRANSRKKEQVAHPARVRIVADGLGGFQGIDSLTHGFGFVHGFF